MACARTLVDGGLDRPRPAGGPGGSAGGLLMGAVANLAPELFRAMVAEVPFVDCLTTILDDTLPLTVIEWEEWGNPVADPEVYRVMKSYSPYDNVRSVDDDGTPVRYPDILVTAGLDDPRVGYWEPAKWVAEAAGGRPREPGPAQDRARRRPRRSLGPLRRLEGRGLRLRLRPRRRRAWPATPSPQRHPPDRDRGRRRSVRPAAGADVVGRAGGWSTSRWPTDGARRSGRGRWIAPG